MSDTCPCCSQVLHVLCPDCGRQVRVEGGKYVAHERMVIPGSHIEWKSCPRGGKVRVSSDKG